MHVKYQGGNRIEVPAEVNGHHFFYLTDPPSFRETYIAKVTRAAKIYATASKDELNQIGAILVAYRDVLDEYVSGAGDAFDAMISSMGVSDEHRFRCSVLVCNWASPHIDDTYEGHVFVSYILHTGVHPYVIQTFNTELSDDSYGIQEIKSSTRLVREGDMMVMDTTTAHMAVPAFPGDGQLLILVQILLDETCADDRFAVLRKYPPRSGDKSIF